jgi:hypothetical protein
MADAATRIWYITEITWDDVDMDMRDRLARGGTGVEADIVAIGFRVQLEVEKALGFLDQGHERSLFVVTGIEPSFDNSTGSNEHMARRDRKAVEDSESQIIRAKPIARRHGEEWGLKRKLGFGVHFLTYF